MSWGNNRRLWYGRLNEEEEEPERAEKVNAQAVVVDVEALRESFSYWLGFSVGARITWWVLK